MPPTVYTVLPVHNRRALTEACLKCLNQQTWNALRVIVVDDGSTDGTFEMVAERFPNVILLRGNGSLWWTAATNWGIRCALSTARDSDYVLVINDDLEIAPDYVAGLVTSAMQVPGAVLGSVTVDIRRPEVIWNGGIIVNPWTAKMHILNQGRRLSEFPRSYCVEVSTLTGRGTLIPVIVIRHVGLYDEVHFQQCGDTEMPLRAAKNGYRLLVSYDAVVRSHVDASDKMNTGATFRLTDLRSYFFGVKSNARLRYRYYFARSAARNRLSISTFFLLDAARLMVHFMRGLRPFSRV